MENWPFFEIEGENAAEDWVEKVTGHFDLRWGSYSCEFVLDVQPSSS
jgi:hypothetical protein